MIDKKDEIKVEKKENKFIFSFRTNSEINDLILNLCSISNLTKSDAINELLKNNIKNYIFKLSSTNYNNVNLMKVYNNIFRTIKNLDVEKKEYIDVIFWLLVYYIKNENIK